jgi:molybdopterin molybdotransferase
MGVSSYHAERSHFTISRPQYARTRPSMPNPLISIAQARLAVAAAVRRLPAETVALDAALGRVLAAEVRAGGDVPPFACSAMDGYAVWPGPAERRLELVGESRAGAPSDREVTEGEAVRISTGATLPPGARAVIPQEETSLDGTSVITRAQVHDGQHVRGAGEDMSAGTPVLAAGRRLGAIELGAAAAAGVGQLVVARRPRVSVICTGDELRAPGEALAPGQIHNSNAPMLTGLAVRLGALAAPAVRLPDEPAATRSGIEAALGSSDVVLISGGVSVGPHDHVKPALAELGVVERFWSVALQPGKPTWFGTVPDGPLVFGLPGNPVSSVVTFSLFVVPALSELVGAPAPRPPWPAAILAEPVTRSPQREQAVRVTLAAAADGQVVATTTGAQGSHRLTSLLAADALAMIPLGAGSCAAGTRVRLEAIASRV